MTVTDIRSETQLVEVCTDAVLGVNKPTFKVGRLMTEITPPGQPPIWADNISLLRAFIRASGSGLN